MNYNRIYAFHPKKEQFLPLPFLRPPILWHVGYGCTFFSLKLLQHLNELDDFIILSVFIKNEFKGKKEEVLGILNLVLL